MAKLCAGFTYYLNGDFVVVTHNEGETSIKTDIETIIAELIGDEIDLTTKRLLCRDSLGKWDGVDVQDGKFKGYVILRARTAKKARESWLNILAELA